MRALDFGIFLNVQQAMSQLVYSVCGDSNPTHLTRGNNAKR